MTLLLTARFKIITLRARLLSALILVFMLFLSATVLASGLLVSTISFSNTATLEYPNTGISWLYTSGQNIYNSSGKQVKLYTLSIQDGEGNHVGQSDIQKIASMGFNSIRIFIEWELIQPNGPSSVGTAYFTQGGSPTIGASVDNVVNWAAQYGMYVELCVDYESTWTPPSWTGFSSASGDTIAADILNNVNGSQSGINYLYQWMGQHYATNSNVIFEGFNEMTAADSSLGGTPFANFNNGWITAVEQGEGSNSHLKIAEFLMLDPAYVEIFTSPYVSNTHSNVLLATHNYEPMSSWDPNSSSEGITYVLSREQAAANAAHSAGYPWINTEWSKATSQNQWQSFYQTVLQGFSQYNSAGWAYFCYDSNPNAEQTPLTSWNLNNSTTATQVLPILSPYMVQP
jgi:aryl-phospho-beta-D-glucosidase BglC (GH1 family)